MLDKIKSWIFRTSLRWFIDNKLDQWARIEVRTKKSLAWVQIDLTRPDNYNWDVLK